MKTLTRNTLKAAAKLALVVVMATFAAYLAGTHEWLLAVPVTAGAWVVAIEI